MKQKRTYRCRAVTNRGRGWSESVGGILEPAAGLAGLGAMRPGRAAVERLWARPRPALPAMPLHGFRAGDWLRSLAMEGSCWGLWRRLAEGPDPYSWKEVAGRPGSNPPWVGRRLDAMS